MSVFVCICGAAEDIVPEDHRHFIAVDGRGRRWLCGLSPRQHPREPIDHETEPFGDMLATIKRFGSIGLLSGDTLFVEARCDTVNELVAYLGRADD